MVNLDGILRLRQKVVLLMDYKLVVMFLDLMQDLERNQITYMLILLMEKKEIRKISLTQP